MGQESEPCKFLREEHAEQETRPRVEAARHVPGKAKGPEWLEQNEEEEGGAETKAVAGPTRGLRDSRALTSTPVQFLQSILGSH